jgi:hypothetical protein
MLEASSSGTSTTLHPESQGFPVHGSLSWRKDPFCEI